MFMVSNSNLFKKSFIIILNFKYKFIYLKSTLNLIYNFLLFFIEKLPEFPEIILEHQILKDKINDVSCGKIVKKHLIQNSSLLSHLECANLIKDNTCFIEFGAGKGKLTYWLGQIIKNKKDCCILLIDRSSYRHKSDNKLKNEQSTLIIERIRTDIADLKLNAISTIQKFKNKVAIAKHLCGAATGIFIVFFHIYSIIREIINIIL